jgi:hypothetical protein
MENGKMWMEKLKYIVEQRLPERVDVMKDALASNAWFTSKNQPGSQASETFQHAFSKEFRKDPPVPLPLPSSV